MRHSPLLVALATSYSTTLFSDEPGGRRFCLSIFRELYHWKVPFDLTQVLNSQLGGEPMNDGLTTDAIIEEVYQIVGKRLEKKAVKPEQLSGALMALAAAVVSIYNTLPPARKAEVVSSMNTICNGLADAGGDFVPTLKALHKVLANAMKAPDA